MPEPYPITRIQPGRLPVREHMGTKRKFWYRDPEDQTDWLFKYPRPNTGEHWAEKIAAEVAARLGIRCAKVELAADNGHQGSTSESFLSASEELVHGNQLLKWTLERYDPGLRFRQSEHSLGNVWRCLDRLFVEAEAAELAKKRFAEYLVLDAVVGNTDRHHENWGLVRERHGDAWVGRLAPSFDHASSLGRELLDDKRTRRLETATVGAYVAKGRGAIYSSADPKRAPAPLELVRRSLPTLLPYIARPLRRLATLRDSHVSEIVHRIPAHWMSRPARDFATTLICHSRDRLLDLAR